MNDTTIHTGFISLCGSVWNSISNIFFVHSGCLKINGRLVIFIIHRFLERPHAWPHTPQVMIRRGLCHSLKDSQCCFLSELKRASVWPRQMGLFYPLHSNIWSLLKCHIAVLAHRFFLPFNLVVLPRIYLLFFLAISQGHLKLHVCP